MEINEAQAILLARMVSRSKMGTDALAHERHHISWCPCQVCEAEKTVRHEHIIRTASRATIVNLEESA